MTSLQRRCKCSLTKYTKGVYNIDMVNLLLPADCVERDCLSGVMFAYFSFNSQLMLRGGGSGVF